MHRNNAVLNGLRRPAWLAAPVFAMSLAAAALLSSADVATAQESTAMPVPAEPPLGDCYGGALSDEPMHCYMLEQAESQGLLEVEAMYDDNGRLYIYLEQADDLSESTVAFLKRKATEFHDRWWSLTPRNELYEGCMGRAADRDYRFCLLENVWFIPDFGTLLPWPNEYKDAEIRPGGAESRRSRAGWASWKQLWPERDPEPPRGAEGGKFDISGVNLTSFPHPSSIKCSTSGLTSVACDGWSVYPQSGVAGWT